MAGPALEQIAEDLYGAGADRATLCGYDLLVKGQYETQGDADTRLWIKRITHQLGAAPALHSDGPFAVLLKQLLVHRRLPFDVMRVICGGEGVQKYKELRDHEAVVSSEDRGLSAVGDEWDEVIFYIIWFTVGPRTQQWYRMAHTPEQLLGDEGTVTRVQRMTPGHLRAKIEFAQLLAAEAGDDSKAVLDALRELQVAGDAVQTCPYIEIDVIGIKYTKGDQPARYPFPCAIKKEPVLACRRRLVGYKDVMRAENELPRGFAAAMVQCDHRYEFIVVVKRKAKRAVFVIARDLIMMDPTAEGSVRTHVNT